MNDTLDLPAFDDEVVRAMAKWPDVPDCYGWLGLDSRGGWRIQGELVRHARAQSFLGRHYRADARGCWYVQNGPQRVFVELDYTPWVYRLQPGELLVTHTGLECIAIDGVFCDDDGNLLLHTPLGLGLLDDRDLGACVALFEAIDEEGLPHALRWRGAWLDIEAIARDAVPSRFGFEPRPH